MTELLLAELLLSSFLNCVKPSVMKNASIQ
jgi:hypothetical protein